MKLRVAFALFLVLVLVARTDDSIKLKRKEGQAEIWGDEAMTRTAGMMLGPPAKDEKAVRAQLAGVTDSFFKAHLLFSPEEAYYGQFLSLPAFIARGVSLANSTKRRCSVVVAFSEKNTYIIFCFSPMNQTLPDPAQFMAVEGGPLSATEEAFRYMEPRLKEALPELRRLVAQLANAAEKQPKTERSP